MFRGPDGKISSMRVVWSLSVLIIILTWSIISFKTNTMQNFSMGDAAWFAALFGGKVGQAYLENQGIDTRRIGRDTDDK